MKWITAISILLLCASGCSDSSSPRWTEEMIRGAKFESMSDTGVLRMSFPENDDFVVTTIGDRNGDVAGPVYEWRIDEAGRLVFLEDEKEIDEFKLIRFSPTEVEVKHNWQGRVIYQRTSSKNPNGEQAGDGKPDPVSS